jgi:hypothetical protein
MHAFGVSLATVARDLAPGFEPRAGLAIVLSFAFLQSLHYAAWLGWIPQEDLHAEGTMSFRMSLRSMVRDFGVPGLACVVVLAVLVVAAAALAPARTRELYFSLATFHGYLEVAMLAYFAAAARTATAASLAIP